MKLVYSLSQDYRDDQLYIMYCNSWVQIINNSPSQDFFNPEISVSPGDRRKSPASRPGRAGDSDPNKKINKYFVLHPTAFINSSACYSI